MYKFLILLSFIFCSLLISAQDDGLPEASQPPRLVNDLVGIMSQEQNQALEQKLVQFNDSTSTQICIIITDDLKGYDKSEYAIRIGEKWGVGQKGKDNGIVIVIKPHGNKSERGAFISVGYGLEGVIPDATAKRILENEMFPHFRKNNFYEGLDAATTVLMKLTSGEFKASDYAKKNNSAYAILGILLIGLIFFMFKIRGTRNYAHSNDIPFLTAWMLMNSGRSSGGSFGNFSSGGGGFGGFGGGSFGGGGAGGSW